MPSLRADTNRRSSRMGVRAYMAVMTAVLLVPLVAVCAFGLGQLLEAEHAAAIRGVQESARALALGVDQELASAEAALRVLATSSYLGNDDFASFYQQATAARTSESAWIVLFDRDGRQILNTALPYGVPLAAQAEPQRITQALQSSAPKVSTLWPDSEKRQYIVAVDVPVALGDGRRYVLAQAFGARYFDRVFTARKLPPNWIAGVFDRDHLTIARSQMSQQYVGRPGSEQLKKAARVALEGELRHPSREGIDIYDVFTRSARTGWLVAIGVPASALDAHAQKAVLVAAIGTLATIAFAATVVFVLGRRLSKSIADIGATATALGRGEPLPPYVPSVREIDELRNALEQTHEVLERETEGRARAEAERLQLFESEQAARQAAEMQNRAKDEFLAMLGHELRNPLSAISGAVALMKAPAAQDEHRSHAREVIARQTQHLSRVVDDLLDLSRVMTGKVVLAFEPVDLARAANNCLNTIRTAGRAVKQNLVFRGEPVWVNADPTRLEQIIVNLLSNAVKYTPPEGSIELVVAAEAEQAVLSVRDTGLGIPKRLLPHVFEVFVQGDQSLERAKGGLGIGLALVQRLVSLHGGTVVAESAGEARGSVFTVRLPRVAAPLPGIEGPASSEDNPRKLRVLVIDDHEDSRTMLLLLLQQTGHEAIEAVDGIDGVQLALSRRPDVAIIDIGLPGINGYEVARRLRSLPSAAKIALIALTGYGQEEDRRRALQAGFDLHLVKPVDAERLAQALIEVTRPATSAG